MATSQRDFKYIVVLALLKLGTAPRKNVLEWIDDNVNLDREDYANRADQEEKLFQNNASWARKKLVMEGVLCDKNFGIWAIADVECVKRLLSEGQSEHQIAEKLTGVEASSSIIGN